MFVLVCENVYMLCSYAFFFFNDTATTEIYTLSLHDALPISPRQPAGLRRTRPRESAPRPPAGRGSAAPWARGRPRSEEHTSELQSRQYLVCRLLLEKKKKIYITITIELRVLT